MRRESRRSFWSGTVLILLAIDFGVLGCGRAVAAGPFLNGFDLSNATIPVNAIIPGGPPRDGIPAIDSPKFLKQSEVSFMEEGDLVIALDRGGISRAYPLRIMLWHEIVNDRIGGGAVAVTYCPLCGTSVVFDAQADGDALNFGVSGLLYQSDVLMYDRQTESLWSQLAFKAVSGPKAGKTLKWVPSQIMTWTVWKKKHPAGGVLSTDTGFRRDYSVNPYAGYQQSPGVWFGVPNNRQDFPNKAWILGIVIDGRAKAYELQGLPANQPVADFFRGLKLRVQYDPKSQQPVVINSITGEAVPFTLSYWFAWQAFYPDTEVWQLISVELDRQLQVTLRGEKGKTYTLETSPDLVHWRVVTNVAVPEGNAHFSLGKQRGRYHFYRTRLTP